MRCIIMKIADTLIFLAYLITIYSADISLGAVSTLNSTVSMNFGISGSKLDKDCVHISEMIRINNLTDYTVNCKTLNTDDATEENVLRHTCFMVKSMLNFICDSKSTVPPSLFTQSNVSSVCPFDFSHLLQMGFKLSSFKLVSELTKEGHCSKVCNDLYSYNTQCIVLYRLINYLKNFSTNESLTAVGTGKFPAKFEHAKTIQKTENTVDTTQEAKDKQSEKTVPEGDIIGEKNESTSEIVSETVKNVAKTTKQQQTEITSTAKEENLSEIGKKENFLSDDDELKSSLEGPNEELEESIPSFHSDVIPVQKISSSSFKGKEIYPGEGFFQAEDSHFFFYFIIVSSSIVVGYLAFHNKNKILAYALEGTSGRRSRRRPNPARYRKLETNLEEAISSCAANSAASSIVY